MRSSRPPTRRMTKFVRGGGAQRLAEIPREVRRRLAVGEQHDQAVLDAFAEEVVAGQRVEGGEGRRLVLESLRRRPLDADRLRQSSREELLVPGREDVRKHAIGHRRDARWDVVQVELHPSSDRQGSVEARGAAEGRATPASSSRCRRRRRPGRRSARAAFPRSARPAARARARAGSGPMRLRARSTRSHGAVAPEGSALAARAGCAARRGRARPAERRRRRPAAGRGV